MSRHERTDPSMFHPLTLTPPSSTDQSFCSTTATESSLNKEDHSLNVQRRDLVLTALPVTVTQPVLPPTVQLATSTASANSGSNVHLRSRNLSTPKKKVPSFLHKLFWWKSATPEVGFGVAGTSFTGHRRTASNGSSGFRQQRRLVVPNHTVPGWDNPIGKLNRAHKKKNQPNGGYQGNRIRTTKYTPLTFVPKNLFEQFHRFANLYFLFIVLLNWVPQISAFGKEVAMVPVLFVLGVTALKDAFEDRRRYKSDKRVNNSTCRVYSRSSDRYVKKLWKEITVGDVVHLSCNEIIPADILILKTSDEQGVCYIETANLDGESNLKQREAVRGMNRTDGRDFQPTDFTSTIECDPPNNMIYKFHGLIVKSFDEKIPVSKDNLLLRDCILKNTDFVEGIVIYAGHETKAMLNNGGPRHKRSSLERFMNRDVLWCIVILMALCIAGAVGSGFWLGSWNDLSLVPFIPYEDSFWEAPTLQGFVNFWTFLIILQVMIPLSLYVTIEIIKLGQVFHMHEDRKLFDAKSGKRVECRALNIPEELGQVQYVFSDKTGTLTENNMIFRRCAIGGVDYNHHNPSGPGNHPSPNSRFPRPKTGDKQQYDNADLVLNPILHGELTKMDLQLQHHHPTFGPSPYSSGPIHLSPECQRIQDFFLLMAVCNTVVVAKHPHKDEMNSSGLYLDTSSLGTLPSLTSFSTPNNFNGPNGCLPVADSPQDRYTRFMNTLETPPSSTASTPTRSTQRLSLPGFRGLGRLSTPSPTPPSPKEIRPFYEAESPDEIALVEASFRYGCKLLKRTLDTVVLSLPGEGLIEYRVLHVLPFDAVRKRMSVILQHPYNCQRILFCKGADSTVLTQLSITQDQEMQHLITKTQQHLNNYSRIGLRILCLAKRVLSPEVYECWAREHRSIEISLEDDRDERLFNSACDIERNLELLGCTGIEDRLQEGVPETIANLRAAGIVVWVLTGDKQETAINIAYSCKLFSMDMEIITLNARSREAAESTLKFYLDQIDKDLTTEPADTEYSFIGFLSSAYSSRNSINGDPGLVRCRSQRRDARALVLDGRTLAFVLEKPLEKLFLKLAMNCASVLCCRATPLQKSYVVKLVKEKLKVLTLAIGDGANDVSMIQTADVGIGISGQEGMQAVMASDFVLARFKHLERLLLVHGHWCYDRLARTILYFFYKNACFIFIIFWFQFFCGFSGAVMIDQLYLMLFNVLFTALPPLVMGIYDRDAPDYILQGEPKLYALGRRSQIYTKYSFWVNMVDALYQSLVIYFVPHFVYHDTDAGIWEFGTTVHTACVLVQLCHISIEIKCWTVLHVLAIIFSVGVYFGFAVVYNLLALGSPNLQNPYYVIQFLMNTANFWFIQILVCILAILPRLVVRVLQNSLTPSQVTATLLDHKLQSPQRPVVSVSWFRDSSVIIRNPAVAEEQNSTNLPPANQAPVPNPTPSKNLTTPSIA